MLKKLRITLVAVGFLGGSLSILPSLVSASGVPSADLKLTMTLLIPTQSLDLSDLDARDQFNRPVRKPEAKRALENLFTKSLSVMLLENLTPFKRDVLFTLSRRWNDMFGWLTKQLVKSVQLVAAWFRESKWKMHWVPSALVLSANLEMMSERWRHSDSEFFLSLLAQIISSTRLLR